MFAAHSRRTSIRESRWLRFATRASGHRPTTPSIWDSSRPQRIAQLSWGGEPVVARYNGPSTPWFLRRNELWLQLS